jgi:hypothetical protein
MKKSANELVEKSKYLVGVGLGLFLSALFLAPSNTASIPKRNIAWLIVGVVLILIGGLYGTMAKRMLAKASHDKNMKDLLGK